MERNGKERREVEDKCPKDNMVLNQDYRFSMSYTCPKCFTEYVKTIEGKLMTKKDFLERKRDE